MPILGYSVGGISSIDRLSSIKWGVRYRLMILGVVTYVLVVARTGTPTVPTALGVPYGYVPAVTRVLGPTIAMSVTILKLSLCDTSRASAVSYTHLTLPTKA